MSFPRWFIAVVLLAPLTAFGQTPSPTKRPDPQEIKALDADLKKTCELHFSGLTQDVTKSACFYGLIAQKNLGTIKAQDECRLVHQTGTRTEVACRIGVRIADKINPKRDTFVSGMKMCQQHYPRHTELDAYLQESCLIGFYLGHDPASGATGHAAKKSRLETCSRFSTERSFLGPCGAGLSLAIESASITDTPGASTFASEQARVCARYFDHRAFHQGYRACVNARALSLDWNPRADRIARGCAEISAGKNNDTEQAACVVGAGIWQSMSRSPRNQTSRFAHCGSDKVQWEQRDVLTCLTAASLLDFGNSKEARGTCKSIFGGRRNRLRDDCSRAVDTLALKPAVPDPAAPMIARDASRSSANAPASGLKNVQELKKTSSSTAQPETPNAEDQAGLGTTPDTATADTIEDVWPEAPDVPDDAPVAADGSETVSDAQESEPSSESTRAPASETP